MMNDHCLSSGARGLINAVMMRPGCVPLQLLNHSPFVGDPSPAHGKKGIPGGGGAWRGGWVSK